jgi:uncharacterized protein YndB with AHSA1/START domain
VTDDRLLLIADLSGYTAYLVGGETEEAPLIAGDLVETIVTHLTADFEVAGLEGDAAFVHAPLDALDGPGLIDAIAGCHDAFRRRIESVRQATTCTCEACQRAPTLELKFFVHVGPVVRQRILGREELAGRDVILVHRLLKGSDPAERGLRSYALLTDATVKALGIDAEGLGLMRVSQEYEHFGEVVGWVGDPVAWLSQSLPDDAASPSFDLERVIPEAAPVVWDLLTVPRLRERWEGIERIDEDVDDRERGLGTRSHCVARRLSTVEEIVDWRPPTAFARRMREGELAEAVVRYDLEATDGGTRLRLRWYGADGTAPRDGLEREIGERIERLVGVAAAQAQEGLATADEPASGGRSSLNPTARS